MDIHRCRFVHYPPSTINALAFSHSKITKSQQTAPPRLAVGRANGDIEIWNPLNSAWLQESIIRGGKDRSVDGLVWTQDPNEEVQGSTIIGKSRLFSIGYTTTVTEWDLVNGIPRRHVSGNHGEIWCLAAQPPLIPSKTNTPSEQWLGQNLIAGCTDGALVLYSTKDDDLQLQKVLIRPSSKKAKIISVTFKDQNIVVAGCSDSTIRIFDTRSGAQIRAMSLGSSLSGGPKETIVWVVKVLRDGTIASGDSTGELKIWDGNTYTMKQKLKGHRQDVLSLATSADGSTIISGGMDRRTVSYKQTGKRWGEVSHRRYHKHDVKSMASFESPDMSVVVSGGPDASPIVLPLRKLGYEYQRALPFLPQEQILQGSAEKRLMMSFWEREVHIWQFGQFAKLPRGEEDEDEMKRNRKLVAKILIKGEANITSASLSNDGSLLAVATVEDVKVFQLRERQTEDGQGLRVSKVTVPSTVSSGARLLQFSPNGKWLSIVRRDSQIVVARVSSDTSTPIIIYARLSKLRRIDRGAGKLALLGGLGSYNRNITQVVFSSDSSILAVSDLAGYIDTFVLAGDEDSTVEGPNSEDDEASPSSDSDSDSESEGESDEVTKQPRLFFGQHWTRNTSSSPIPRLPSIPTILSFKPPVTPCTPHTNGLSPHSTRHTPHPVPHNLPSPSTTPDCLFVITACGSVFEFNVLLGSLTPWSRRNPTSVFPDNFRKTLDHTRGCLWDVTSKHSRVWIYGVNWIWMFDLLVDLPVPQPESNLTNGHMSEDGSNKMNNNKKRKRKGGKVPSTGAGSAIPDRELDTGISRKTQRVVHEEINQEQSIFNDHSNEMDLDTDNEQHTSLARLRRSSTEGERKEQGSSNWNTSKYRPILGIVALGKASASKGGGLEVAIVERPIWEVELPPRFYGDQEWEKEGIDTI
ncbi:WD40-repeat-containing domain protein [Amylocarpus encephaloides]|uniref:WD40-repeat-containing domain protein n=1 Tax=Amylocarpus encephaloides TaxID=45428 RepID=A0A9P7YR63_9HELO|nr:WD40-repeat-containing domain protein [Amylocarpus encephaloides]